MCMWFQCTSGGSLTKTRIASNWLAKLFSAEFIRFVFMGGLNTVLTNVFYMLLLFILPYAVSFTVSYIAGIGLAYYLNSVFVFKKRMEWKKALQFPVVYIVQYLIGLGLMFLLIELAGVNEVLAPWLVVLLTLPITFLMSRFIIKGRVLMPDKSTSTTA